MDECERLVNYIAETATRIGCCFTEPDAEWIPAGFVEADGNFSVLPLDFSTDVLKAASMFALSAYARMSGATTVAFITPAWMSDLEALPPGMRPRTAPADRRAEILSIEAVSRERHLVATAEVQRHEDDPPTLAPWEVLDVSGGAHAGFAYDALVAAVRP